MDKVGIDAEKLKFLAQEMCRLGEDILGKCEAALAVDEDEEESEEEDEDLTTESFSDQEDGKRGVKKMMLLFLKKGKRGNK